MVSYQIRLIFQTKKGVRLAHTRAGARLRQQPYSSARSAPPAGGFCVIGNAVSYTKNRSPHFQALRLSVFSYIIL